MTSLVDMLVESRRGSTAVVLDQELTFDEAFELQLEVADRLVADGDSIGGWKVAMSSGAGRDMMGVDFRPFGFVLGSRIFGSGDSIALAGHVPALIEPELCLILGEPLGTVDVTPEQARAAVRAVAPAFELVELRQPFGGAETHPRLVADAVGQSAIVVGEEVAVSALPTPVAVELFRDGEQVATATAGDTIEIDDPFLALARIASLLGEHGRGLEPGQAVLTGSFAALPVQPGTAWRAEFRGLGEISITFS